MSISNVYKTLLSACLAVGLLSMSAAVDAKQCRWVHGYWNHGSYHHAHRVCWGHRTHCTWHNGVKNCYYH